ncbi:MAG: TlpA family protein disulfide reductase [Candidatus Eremiobacteraeota bacterium]|nr:TlpA family protein disulfide reductase [Candidatus Eremiobacteraeota bacterium]
MNRRIAWIAGLAAAVVLAMLAIPMFRSDSLRPAGPGGLAGRPAPLFALRDDRGAPVSLADYRGKVVVVNLWASWCPPCRAEMPDLQRLASAYASRGVVVIGVNQGESAQRARAFSAALRIAFPIWLDPQQQYGRVFTAAGLPTTVFVGRNGRVVRGVDGALSFDEMRAAIAALLAP